MWYDAIRYDMIQYDAMWYDAIRDMLQCNVIRCDKIRYVTMQYDAIRYVMMQCDMNINRDRNWPVILHSKHWSVLWNWPVFGDVFLHRNVKRLSKLPPVLWFQNRIGFENSIASLSSVEPKIHNCLHSDSKVTDTILEMQQRCLFESASVIVLLLLIWVCEDTNVVWNWLPLRCWHFRTRQVWFHKPANSAAQRGCQISMSVWCSFLPFEPKNRGKPKAFMFVSCFFTNKTLF